MARLSNSVMRGLSFGLTSGVITTLGLMVGLYTGTHSRIAVLGGILTIAVADALSDSLGVHISEEYTSPLGPRQVWLATGMTFITKFLMALSFALPLWWWELDTAVFASVLWGMLVITLLSVSIARTQGEPAWKVIIEHLSITVLVVLLTHGVGRVVESFGAAP